MKVFVKYKNYFRSIPYQALIWPVICWGKRGIGVGDGPLEFPPENDDEKEFEGKDVFYRRVPPNTIPQ